MSRPLPAQCILVLDDYHLLDAGAVDQALTFLLDHRPPQLHLVITTREDPNVPLARYRARGQLTEVRAVDLRFTADEAADFLNGMMGLALTTDEVTALEMRTEGWIAGLQLAAISMQGHPAAGENNRAAFIQSFAGSHRFVLDYLMEEVLHQQPETIQTFLLRTSILERFCAPLCDALLDAPASSGQATLEALEQANLFLIPLDNERRWYRYHHLFADVLQARARKAQPDQLSVWHGRASKWYEAHGRRAAAIRHALAAAEFARAADLIELAWSTIHSSSFQSPLFLSWVKALPASLIRTRPVLSVGAAWQLLDTGKLEAAQCHLRAAEEWLARSDRADGQMVVVDEAQFQLLPATIAIARTCSVLKIASFKYGRGF